MTPHEGRQPNSYSGLRSHDLVMKSSDSVPLHTVCNVQLYLHVSYWSENVISLHADIQTTKHNDTATKLHLHMHTEDSAYIWGLSCNQNSTNFFGISAFYGLQHYIYVVTTGNPQPVFIKNVGIWLLVTAYNICDP